jgi:hypothetical protein
MAELFQLAAILLAGPLLLTIGAVAWVRYDHHHETQRRARQWRQRFLEGR